MSENNDALTPEVPAAPDPSPEPEEAVTTTIPEVSAIPEERAVTTTESAVSEPGGRARPQVTFMGNSYDLTAVVAVVTGGVIAFSCLTCNLGYYCLPVVPVVLGLVGLLSAEDSVDPSRTRLLSWLGVGGGGIVILLMLLGLVLYFGFIILAIMFGAAAQGQ